MVVKAGVLDSLCSSPSEMSGQVTSPPSPWCPVHIGPGRCCLPVWPRCRR